MNDKNLAGDRRSARLFISIPIVISGKDAEGREFKENVRTVLISKHGAKILTAHQLAMGKEVLLENKTQGNMAKAKVVWLGTRRTSKDLYQVGLQLVEAQDIWGIEFPPDDWTLKGGEEEGQASRTPAPGPAHTAGNIGTPVSTALGESPAGLSERAAQEITSRILQQIEQFAEAQIHSFRERLEKIKEQIGLELEADVRAHAAPAKEPEANPLDQHIRLLGERLNAAFDEIKRLEIQIEELRDGLQSLQGGVPRTPAQVEEARQQLTTLVHSVVESMNRAAEAGLKEYRDLLQKELQEHTARLRSGS